MPSNDPPTSPICNGQWVCTMKTSTGDCWMWKCVESGSDGGDDGGDDGGGSSGGGGSGGGGIGGGIPVPAPTTLPVARFIYQLLSESVVRFTNTSFSADSYVWEFGDGTRAISKNPQHTYPTGGGIFTVTLTARNRSGISQYTETFTVLNTYKRARFSYLKSGLSVQFTDTSTVVSTSWLWDFGDGATSTLQSPYHLYVADGVYLMQLTIAGYVTSTYVTVAASSGPAGFVPVEWTSMVNSTATPGSNDLKKTSDEMDTQGGAISVQQIASALVGAGVRFKGTFCGPYDDMFGNGVTCGLSYANTNETRETVHFGISLSGPGLEAWPAYSAIERFINEWDEWDYQQIGTSHEITNCTGYDSIVWSLEINSSGFIEYKKDGVTFATSTRTLTFPLFADASLSQGWTSEINGARLNDVEINTGEGGESESIGQTIPLISAQVSLGSLTVNFNNASSGTTDSCYWDFGDGQVATGCSVSHTYSAYGIYLVTLTVCNALGCYTTTQIIYIKDTSSSGLPFEYPTVSDFTVSSPYATTGDPLDFTGPDSTSCGDSAYDWDWGDGTAHGTTQSPSHTYAAAGTYTVTLTFMCDSVQTVYSMTVVIDDETTIDGEYISRMPPLIDVLTAVPQVGMVPLTVVFTCTAINSASFLWNLGDGTTSTQSTFSHTFYNPGTYRVTVDLLNSFGVAHAEVDVVVLGWASTAGDEYIGYYIVDTPNDRVLIFSKDGAYLGYFGRTGTGVGQFRWPTQLTAVSATQKLDRIVFE